jgi:hypothetical protein
MDTSEYLRIFQNKNEYHARLQCVAGNSASGAVVAVSRASAAAAPAAPAAPMHSPADVCSPGCAQQCCRVYLNCQD